MGNILTKSGYQAMQSRLEKLRKKRERLISEMEAARQEGDLRENSAYHQLRETVTIITQQIQRLEAQLANAKIVSNTQRDKIAVGSKVLVMVGKRQRRLEIVGEGEADPLNGKISVSSPVAQQLLGAKKGDKIEVTLPNGEKQIYKILAIE